MKNGRTHSAGPPRAAVDGLTWDALLQEGCFKPIDLHFSRLLSRLSGVEDPDLLLCAALVSSQAGQGHVCLDLSMLDRLGSESGGNLVRRRIDPSGLCDSLQRYPVVVAPGEIGPLVLDQAGRLYLHRFWEDERFVAERISSLASQAGVLDRKPLPPKGQGLLATTRATQEPDWHLIASCAALTHRLTVITGGPGTGKTTTVARLMTVLLDRPGTEGLTISLAAPTGKAAARLTQSMRKALDRLDLSQGLRDRMPEAATTLHRMLGSMGQAGKFHHGPDNPLPADVVIVDEASMIDLPMMARLLQALGAQASLVLLGDKDQLSSVEAGAVLGDICRGPVHLFSDRFTTMCRAWSGVGDLPPAPPGCPALVDAVVELRHSYRFGSDSGIGRLSRAVLDGDAGRAETILSSEGHPDVIWHRLPEPAGLRGYLAAHVLPALIPAVTSRDPARCFEALERFQLLCPMRKGPYGLIRLVELLDRLLQEQGLVPHRRGPYAGQPFMVLRNEYQTGLYNGDVGIFLPEEGELRAVFPTPEGFRFLSPARLPDHESVYAMTVHKAQGSEFDKILLILPDTDSPLLTRELLYTALTRARQQVTLACSRQALHRTIARRTSRASGLYDALWGGNE